MLTTGPPRIWGAFQLIPVPLIRSRRWRYINLLTYLLTYIIIIGLNMLLHKRAAWEMKEMMWRHVFVCSQFAGSRSAAVMMTSSRNVHCRLVPLRVCLQFCIRLSVQPPVMVCPSPTITMSSSAACLPTVLHQTLCSAACHGLSITYYHQGRSQKFVLGV